MHFFKTAFSQNHDTTFNNLAIDIEKCDALLKDGK